MVLYGWVNTVQEIKNISRIYIPVGNAINFCTESLLSYANIIYVFAFFTIHKRCHLKENTAIPTFSLSSNKNYGKVIHSHCIINDTYATCRSNQFASYETFYTICLSSNVLLSVCVKYCFNQFVCTMLRFTQYLCHVVFYSICFCRKAFYKMLKPLVLIQSRNVLVIR